MNYRF